MQGLRPSKSKAAAERRARIVDAARDLLREREEAKVIVGDVAELAGVSPATVYNLIGTRDHLMAAVLEEAVVSIDANTPPVDPNHPVDAALGLIQAAADVLSSDPVAFRRVIGAMSEARTGVRLATTFGDLLARRLHEVEDAFDGSIPLDDLASLIHIGFRGVLISWSYGQIADDQLARSGEAIALHILSTTIRPDIALDIKRRLVASPTQGIPNERTS